MRIRKLNTLRGLAALIVLVAHYSDASRLWNGLLGRGAGLFGVMLFFLLSAFLIAYLYLETPPSSAAIKNYLVARIARVVPLFLLVVGLSYAAQHSNVEFLQEIAYNVSGLKQLLSHLLLIREDSVLWTIPPEIHFYILFLFVWMARPRFFKWILCILGLILVVYIRYGIFVPSPDQPPLTIFAGFHARLDILAVFPYFIAGLLMGQLFCHWRPPGWLVNHWFVLALLGIPFLYPQVYRLIVGTYYHPWAWLNPAIFVCVSLVFFIIVFLVPPGNPFLENKAGDKLGEISYSLYLLHMPMLIAMKKLGLATANVRGLLLFVLFSLIVAFLSFTFFEAPMRRTIRKVFSPGGLSR